MTDFDASDILKRIDGGDQASTEELLPIVYGELKRIAAKQLANEKPGQTLQPTALVHEVFVRLTSGQKDFGWKSRGHFFAAAAESMRRILVDRSRKKNSLKAGGEHQRVALTVVSQTEENPGVDILDLHDALHQLESVDPRKAELVKLRYFAGLTISEAAHCLEISTSTAENWWAYAKAWLCVALRSHQD